MSSDGILTDLSLYQYAVAPNVCDACFDAGKSPHEYFVCVSGVKIGDAWNPGELGPPYSWFPCTPIGVCSWQYVDARYVCTLAPVGPNMRLQIHSRVPSLIFTSTPGGLCTRLFFNEIVDPVGNPFYSGRAMLLAPLKGGSFSLDEAMEIITDVPDPFDWDNPSVTVDGNFLHKFSRDVDSSVIKVILEP